MHVRFEWFALACLCIQGVLFSSLPVDPATLDPTPISHDVGLDRVGLKQAMGLEQTRLPSSRVAFTLQPAVHGHMPKKPENFSNFDNSEQTFQLTQPLETPLNVYVETENKSILYKAHYLAYVVEALSMWSSALNGRLRFVLTPDPSHADITVQWVSGFADRSVAGLTIYRVGNARIQLKTPGIPDKDLKANIIHEFGHALGIGGHSPNQNDIMVGVRRWKRNNTDYEPKLSPRDIAAIRRLYSPFWHHGENLYSAIAQTASHTAN